MNSLDRQWFYKSFRKKLREEYSVGKADKIWDEAGAEYDRILSKRPDIKKHKGAMVIPAAALYRVLKQNNENVPLLLNAYGEYMGKRIARIVHRITSIPGVDRLIWHNMGSIMDKMSGSLHLSYG